MLSLEELSLHSISKHCRQSTKLVAARITDMDKTQFRPFRSSQLRLVIHNTEAHNYGLVSKQIAETEKEVRTLASSRARE